MEQFDNLKKEVVDDSFDVKDFILKIYAYWYLFLLSIGIALSVAWLVNKMTVPIYSVSTSVLVQQEQSMLDSRFASSMGLYDNQYQISNEVGILKSYLLTQRAIKNLNFTVRYYTKNKFIEKELYKDCPFIILIDSSVSQPLFSPIQISIINANEVNINSDIENVNLYDFKYNKFNGSVNSIHINKRVKLFSKISGTNFSFTIIPRYGKNLKEYTGQNYFVKFFDELSLINQFRYITVTENKSSSILSISITGTNVPMLVEYLNALSNEYLKKGIEKKNQIAENTLRFINSQLIDITDSLHYSEKRLQDFKANKAIMNVDFQAQQVYTALENIQNQKAELLVKDKYYKYLKNYLLEKNNTNIQDLIAPSSIGIQDPALGSLINELTRIFTERSEMAVNSKKDNPYLAALDIRIKDMKNSILENIDNLIHATNIAIQDVDHRMDEISSRLNKLPEAQRQLFGYERKFKLNDALYTYLLTKRSEVQISKASYLPNNEIVDQARDNEYASIAPRSHKNFMLALLLGLGVPIGFILLKDFFNDKILTNEDIESLTRLPILGHILRNKEKSRTIVADFPMSLTTESIRAIRTSFQFVANENQKHIILITSSMMSEGKSFTCLNLGLSFALNNKKILIINFDMRKPKIQEYLDMESDVGLSSFLSGYVKIDDVILNTRFQNLDVILSGPIPPNPMELIGSEQTRVLLDVMKQRYDYVLLDTPPIGMVADALLLTRHSDVNIFVVRHNYTFKKVFAQVNQNINKKGISFNIILNDVQVGKKHMAYSHGYAYTYGYGYGYSNNGENIENKNKKKKKKNVDSKFFKLFH